MQHSSGRHGILLTFSIVRLLAGLSLDGAWSVRFPVVAAVLVAAVVALRETWSDSKA